MVREFQHVKDTGYDVTYVPLVSVSTLRLFLSLVTKEILELHHTDVKTAFSNGDLNEDIYIEEQKGLEHTQFLAHVCKDDKALHGLKHAPRQWFAEINTFVKDELIMKS